MLKRVVAVDKYIIQVYRAEIVKVILQGIVDVALKAAQAVIYTKEYNIIFKLAKAQCKCSLPFITLLYPKAVKSGNNIKLGIKLGLVKPFKGLIYK